MSNINVSSITRHMIDSADNVGLLDSWFYHLIDKQLSKLCGSPIEAMLGAALLFSDKLSGMPGYPLFLAAQSEIPEWDKFSTETRLLIPQFKFEDYRIDWVYRDGLNLTFIECDGHGFHEKTKEQVARDKLRDRRIQAAGHPILRFSGSEIWKDPFHCATQIMDFVNDRNVPADLRGAV